MLQDENSNDRKLKLLEENSSSLLESHKIQVNQSKILKTEILSLLKDSFSSEFGIVIQEVTNLIEETSKLKLDNNQKLENKEIELEESPAAILGNRFKNDEIFSKLQICQSTWSFFSLDEPMILNQVYKLRLREFQSISNSYAIDVGVSIQKHYKETSGSINKLYGYIVKTGEKASIKGSVTPFAEKANEGDIIGVCLSYANDEKYNLEIFKNGVSLGIAFEVPIQDYYFCYAMCNNTSIEISDGYSFYTK